MNPFEAISKALNGGKLMSHEDADSFEMDGMFIKVMVLKRGDQIVTHAHKYSHAHILGKGRIKLEVDGSFEVYSAPAIIEIKAGRHHGMTALEDSTGFCVHNVDHLEDGEIVGEQFRG